ncbi:class I ribonucleotide reductase maintenance protein YfaE [Colwellia sp. 1_MG-2023]|uniref:class I ribonucleotide reductase maintenance protein YfaE n=1 Tax=Colwellia sp. 1_MG-2023 TaxID=3062649 RepID=UPI0026E422AF|nr:class I ribonucleotide reductase maintenance protein YfaE [Colwellia sp. 1_MG-2023]MDO6446079.1 class I ribonucleotide reductase maintenance protein YfaE [Colwellia sp. 1_MG-2023]
MTDAKDLNNKTTSNKAFTITVEHQSITFDPDDKTLLNNLEKNDIEVHYHCRDGFCGACRVTLAEGKIHYPNGEPLAFVGENEILPCCCIPASNIRLIIE